MRITTKDAGGVETEAVDVVFPHEVAHAGEDEVHDGGGVWAEGITATGDVAVTEVALGVRGVDVDVVLHVEEMEGARGVCGVVVHDVEDTFQTIGM